MNTLKPKCGVITGQTLPRHLGVAYGRHIFKLLHTESAKRGNGLWLRDLPTSLLSLDREYGITEPLRAYLAECGRTGQPQQVL